MKRGSSSALSEQAQKLDTAARRIQVAAGRTLHKTIARRRELDRQGRGAETMVVVIGGAHNVFAHHGHNMKFLDGLILAGERPAVAMEESRLRLMKAFRAANNNRTTAAEEARLEKLDSDGRLTLLAQLASEDRVCDGHHTHAAFARFLRARRLDVRYVDAAMYGDFELDGFDPIVSAIHQNELGRETPEWIDAGSADGIRIRNFHMAWQSRGLAREKAPRLMVLFCGVHHAAGFTPKGFEGPHSVAAQFKRLGFPVLAGVTRMRDVRASDIPADNGLSAKERMPIYGLPETRAAYDPADPGPMEGRGAALVTPFAEVSHINGVMRRCGLGEFARSIREREQEQAAACAEMHRAFIGLRAAARAMPTT